MTAHKMEAVVYKRYGSPEVLEIKSIQKPQPGENEILIKIFATAITSGDLKLRSAKNFPVRMFNGFFKPKNQVLGSSFAGQIEAIGRNVKKYKVGQKVFGYSLFGSYAQYKIMPDTGTFVIMPDNISYREAAAIPFGALSALFFLKKARIKQGDNILINGASGDVGVFAVQLAKNIGAIVTGVAGKKSLPIVKKTGADHVINYQEENFTKNGKLYDVIFDVAGKLNFNDVKNSLTGSGNYITTAVGLKLLTAVLFTKFFSNKKVKIGMVHETKSDLQYIADLVDQGKIIPVLDRSFNWRQINESHNYAENSKKNGSVVVVFNN